MIRANTPKTSRTTTTSVKSQKVRTSSVPLWFAVLLFLLGFSIFIIVLYVLCFKDGLLEYRQPWTEQEYLDTVPPIVTAKHTDIPRHIWTFWDPPTDPLNGHTAIVNACVDTWRRACPDYTITVLNTRASLKYLPERLHRKHFNSTQRYTDFLRLFILAEHGGIWMDASIFMLTSLDDWLHSVRERHSAEVVAYYMRGFTTQPQWPMVESWFIASVPQSLTIQHWRNAFCRTMMFETDQAYLVDVYRQRVDLQLLNMREYLVVYVAFQVALQTSPAGTDLAKRIVAIDSAEGPFRIHILEGWDSGRIARTLCSPDTFHKWLKVNESRAEDMKLVKLRGSEREAITRRRGCVHGFQDTLLSVN